MTEQSAAGLTAAGAVTSLTGTANQVSVSAAVGAVTLSLPNSGTLPGAWSAATGFTVSAGGLTVTAGGLTVTAGGAAITGATSVAGAFSTTGASGTGTFSQGVTVTAGGLTVSAGPSTITGDLTVTPATVNGGAKVTANTNAGLVAYVNNTNAGTGAYSVWGSQNDQGANGVLWMGVTSSGYTASPGASTGIIVVGSSVNGLFLNTGSKGLFAPGFSAFQTASALWAGTGVPANGSGANGDYYFRSDGGVTSHIYYKSAGAWAGVI